MTVRFHVFTPRILVSFLSPPAIDRPTQELVRRLFCPRRPTMTENETILNRAPREHITTVLEPLLSRLLPCSFVVPRRPAPSALTDQNQIVGLSAWPLHSYPCCPREWEEKFITSGN